MTDDQGVLPARPGEARPCRPPPGPGRHRRNRPDWRQFRELLNRVQDFMVLVGPEGQVVFANRSWCDALGIQPAEVQALHCRDVVPPDELDRWHHWLDPGRSAGELGPVRLTWRSRAGRDVPAEGTLEICDDQGPGVRLLGIFHDLSSLAATQAALREAEAIYHVIETRAPIGIFQADSQGRLIRTNRRWRVIASLDHTSQPRGAWWQMVDPCDRDRVLADWKAAQRYGYEYRGEFRVNAGASIERYARTTVVPGYTAERAPDICMGVSEDITDQRRYEKALKEAQSELERRVRLRTAQLEAANRELAQFAHVAAHDLKAPLRAVNNIAEWLHRDYLNRLEPSGVRFLHLLRQRVHHMHDLIEGILAYTRFGQLAEADVEVDLQELLAQILTLLAPPPEITLQLPLVLPRVRGVPERLRHIFQNLLDNAIKFMDKPEGVVTLTASRLPTAWEFAVSDNGAGIAPRYHARVFHMFEQLPGRRKTGGTGIGLALVKRIVESRGGRIAVASEEGMGATFTFTWPDTPAVDVQTGPEAVPQI